MRSRYGYLNLLFSICTIIIFHTNLYGSEYFISYRAVVKNAILINSSLLVSPAMSTCSGIKGASVYLKREGLKSLQKIILKNFIFFSSYMDKLGVQIKSFDYNTNDIADSLTILTLKPLCFTVDFNQNFVKITALNVK